MLVPAEPCGGRGFAAMDAPVPSLYIAFVVLVIVAFAGTEVFSHFRARRALVKQLVRQPTKAAPAAVSINVNNPLPGRRARPIA